MYNQGNPPPKPVSPTVDRILEGCFCNKSKKGITMKIVNSVLKMVGRAPLEKAVANETKKKDPKAEDLDKILAKNTISDEDFDRPDLGLMGK